MSEEYKVLETKIKKLKIGLIVMAIVVAVLAFALYFSYRLSNLSDDRIINGLRYDIDRLNSELKQLK